MSLEPKYLLILSCSGRKRTDEGLLPAIERYTGVNYAVLRKAMREGYWPNNLDLLIVSAKYGLLEPETPIPYYDQKMTSSQALSLRDEVSARLAGYLAATSFEGVFINLGRTYRAAIAPSSGLPLLGDKVLYAEGTIGKRMARMKAWLRSIAGADN